MARSYSPNVVACGLAAVLASLAAGWAVTQQLAPALLAGLLIAAVGGYALMKPWGSAVVVAPAFMFPAFPDVGPLREELVVSGPVLGLAIVYWALGGGRPKLSASALGAGLVILSFGALAAFEGGASAQAGMAPGATMLAGLILGPCLARDRRAATAAVLLVAPLALLAVLEAVGFPNPWRTVLGIDRYSTISGQSGALRSTSSFAHPLIAGGVMVVFAALAFSMRWVPGRPVVLGCLLAGVLATVSRSALLALLAATLVVVAQAAKRPGRAVAVVATICVVAFAAYQVPAISESLTTRIAGFQSSSQVLRAYALDRVSADWERDPGALMVGGGVRRSRDDLTSRGGFRGFTTYDNQYVTALYDYGLTIVLVAIGLLGWAVYRGDRTARRVALPAIAAGLVMIAFVDGLYWPSLGLAVFTAIGYAAAPARRITR